MTILPLWSTVAGLKVPADSQVAPWGERMGVCDGRRDSPKGRSAVCAAKAREAARSEIVGRGLNGMGFSAVAATEPVDGYTKGNWPLVFGGGFKDEKERINAESTENAEATEEEKVTGLKTGHYKDKRFHFAGLGDLGGSNCMVRTMPSPSLTKITWFGFMSLSVSTRPLGQRISSISTF